MLYWRGIIITYEGVIEEDIAFITRMVEWDSHNHIILTWLYNTSISSISNLLGSFDDAYSTWDMLVKCYSTSHGSTKYQLVVELNQPKQELGQSVNDYYDQLRFIWDQIDLSNPTWACLRMLNDMLLFEMNFVSYKLIQEQPLQSGFDASSSHNRHKQSNKKFYNYCKHPSDTIETCCCRNKSIAVVANTESTQPMSSISTESQYYGSTINLSSTEL
ncbi:hypothetical protein SO802_009765 [Lithocarpus litseifolius]|uniref:Retrotransposon gag domain-containing protein n=1 Tax=Lithocarpus litseifolius TaxID=425828 RepID=A0AAW2DEY4_9ROSI